MKLRDDFDEKECFSCGFNDPDFGCALPAGQEYACAAYIVEPGDFEKWEGEKDGEKET